MTHTARNAAVAAVFREPIDLPVGVTLERADYYDDADWKRLNRDMTAPEPETGVVSLTFLDGDSKGYAAFHVRDDVFGASDPVLLKALLRDHAEKTIRYLCERRPEPIRKPL